jgi:hypothetical protein
MTPPELATLRAVWDIRKIGRVASLESLCFCTRREKRTVRTHLAALRDAGYIAPAGFLGDSPRGVRLTGHGKALFEQAEVYRRDQAGQ